MKSKQEEPKFTVAHKEQIAKLVDIMGDDGHGVYDPELMQVDIGPAWLSSRFCKNP